jgi:type I restriction enzyme S subunit
MEVRKQTQSGIYPSDWSSKPLSLLSSFISKGATPTTYGYNWEKDGVLFLRSECVSENGLDLSQSMFISLEAHKALIRGEVLAGDILMTITGNVGRVVLLDNKFETANTNQHIAHIRIINPDVNAGYIYHYLSQPSVRNYYNSITTGQAYPQISLPQVRNTEVPLPPFSEQEAIAEALSDADDLIEAVEQLLTKKRQVKQGAMSELLTGKRRLSGFSGEWEVKTFGDLFNFSGGFTASRDQLSSDGYCYLHYGDIHMSKKTFVDVQSEFQEIPKLNIPLKKVSTTSLLEDGDIVFVDASEDDEGASRHVVIVNPNKIPYISGLHTIVAKSKTDELEKQYRRYCFQTREVKNQFRFYAVGTKVSGISKTNIAKINLPVPSIPEQTAIAEILSDMDAEISALEEKLVKARQVKAGMMSELLTGKIRLV